MYTLKNNRGQRKTVKNGVSWTVAIWGFLVPLFRGDIKWFAIMLLTNVILAYATAGIGSIIVNAIFAFKYNEWYVNDLLASGYEIV